MTYRVLLSAQAILINLSPNSTYFFQKEPRSILKATSCKYDVIPCLLWKTHPRCLWYYFTRVIFLSLWVIVSTNQSMPFYFPNQTLPNNFERPDVVFKACLSLKAKSHLNSFLFDQEKSKACMSTKWDSEPRHLLLHTCLNIYKKLRKGHK